MEFKTFMQAVEHRLDQIKSESELRDWLKNYARTIPEKEREAFLKQFEKTEYQTHEQVIKEVSSWCQKVEDGDIMLSCREYEEYGDSYWEEDYVTEYEDPDGIGGKLEQFYEMAEQCVYDRDYQTANSIYFDLGTLHIAAYDEEIGESYELDIADMNSEGLTKLNLKRIASLTMYSQYQVSEPEKRAEDIYEYFGWPMFREIRIEDMMSAGAEPLNGIDEFIESWITYLREQDHKFTARLLKEAVMYKNGSEGLLQEAKRCALTHPSLFIEALESFYSAGAWEKLAREGKEALKLMDRDMQIRGKAARLAAAGARNSGDEVGEKQAYFEAFYSELSTDNYLRLITCEKVTDQERKDADIRLETVRKSHRNKPDNYRAYGSGQDDKAHYKLQKDNYLEICFFEKKYQEILSECKKEKNSLGWSGQFINEGISMLLLLLCKGQINGRAMNAIILELSSDVGYREEYDEPEFKEIIEQWKKQADLSVELEKEILNYLQTTIDSRVEAIVSGGHRKSYFKAARLGAALGEAEESLGILKAKELRIHKYFGQFPRHRAFKDEMKAYM